MRRIWLGFLVATAMLIAAPSGANAQSVTIGQTGTPEPGCGLTVDRAQPTVTSGNGYVVPSTGGVTDWRVTSWSTNAHATPGQALKMKIFRPLGGSTYLVVGHDLRSLTPSTLNTFSTNIVAKAGDVLGLNGTASSGATFDGCDFAVTGESYVRTAAGTDLADGASGAFPLTVPNFRLNITAQLTPAATCKGEDATIGGTSGNDNLVGTSGDDVIAARGGKDTVRGLGGKDLVCGGAGKDTLRGGSGKDKLLGQGGKDKLVGGGGKDVCKGGKKDDTAKKCEVEKSI
jgi:Ca2+-binding RTX toxin-like protein